MTWALPPDSRATTHWPNDPPGVPPVYVALLALAALWEVSAAGLADGAATCAAGADAGSDAGADDGPSWPGGLGIRAGSAGICSTWPGSMRFAHWILLRLAQYSTGHA